jgi:PTS system nitrogen regulatory IIA component
MNLSVKDIAELLNVSEKTIYRMIQSESIPCFRVGGQWRFDQREIASWVEDTRAYKTPLESMAKVDEEFLSIAEFIQRGGVHLNVSGTTQAEAVKQCLERIRETLPEIDTAGLFDAIVERESLCTTAVGHGVALPHPRIYGKFTAASHIALCRLHKPVSFGAIDNEDVDTLFFIFPKNERRFLRTQAKLLRLLRDDDVLSCLKQSDSAADILALIARKESEIFPVTEA